MYSSLLFSLVKNIVELVPRIAGMDRRNNVGYGVEEIRGHTKLCRTYVRDASEFIALVRTLFSHTHTRT